MYIYIYIHAYNWLQSPDYIIFVTGASFIVKYRVGCWLEFLGNQQFSVERGEGLGGATRLCLIKISKKK